ncbi:expressed unknown protein [Seminavis robusta]|uniref:Uncharacterized protein n=1 Tax=Seminavis robusta TaxID=568900 RepID=A0A9N8EW73_9STRA|nr:expressed unknown protein [Seminavis robusta]|eukprot:Sro2098_g314390.1 n/a (139) ;mRNA; r:8909-9413
MLSRNVFLLVCLLCLAGISQASSGLRATEEQSERHLQFDSLFPTDLCKNGPGDDDIGPCDTTKFVICGPGEVRCYNRKVWRDKFHTDIKQPMFYIDYDLVLCYPQFSGACSSCSPGRFCQAESRCILDELNYDCPMWL